jgi:hypothetical protein
MAHLEMRWEMGFSASEIAPTAQLRPLKFAPCYNTRDNLPFNSLGYLFITESKLFGFEQHFSAHRILEGKGLV